MSEFKANDLVKINNDKMLKTYGVVDQVFTVKSVDKFGVKLNNGWTLDPKYLVKQAPQRVAVSEDDLEELVENRVRQLVKNNRMFTVYDVTTQIRKQSPNLNIIHNDVKRVVEDIYDDFDLTRTLIPIANPNPWLYHDWDQDPNEYVKNMSSDKSTTSVTQPKVLKMTINFK